MVKITNGITTMEVPVGSYKSMFAHQGYHIVEEERVEHNGEADANNNANSDERFVSEIREKPLSQWNREEVKRYAAINGINIAGTKNPGEAKQLIKAFMQEHSED